MKFKLSIFSLFAIATIITACEETHKNIPEINITSPQNEEKFYTGDTVFIKANLTAVEDIHGYDVTIKEVGGDTVFYVDEHAHGTAVEVDTFWVDTFTHHAHCQVFVTAVGDHSGTTETDTVFIHCDV